MRMVCDALTRQGFAVSAAIAGTSVCARTMTRHVHGRIVRDGEEADAVRPLPVFALGADDAITRGPAPRRAENHRRCRLAARATKSPRGSAPRFTTLLEQALGQGDAPISPRKPLPDYIVEKRFAEPVATEGVISATLSGWPRCWSAAMDQQGKGARRLEASFFRTDGAVRAHRGRYRTARDQSRGDRPPVPRAARCLERSARSRFRLRSHSPVRQPHRNRGAAAARSRCQCARQ